MTYRSNYKEYIEGRSWACEKSPSGAHHWIIFDGKQACRFCGEERSLVETNPQRWRPQ